MACKSSMSLFYNHVLFSLSILTLFASPASAFFRFGGKVIVSARMDPIVAPGKVSQHMHNVVGGSSFGKDYDYDTQRKSACTSVDISVDKSAYWAPGLYYVNKTSDSVTRIPSYFVIYYLDRLGSKESRVLQWPAGLKVVGGNPNRRSNGGKAVDDAVSYVCLDYYGDQGGRSDRFFTHNCPNGMRAQVVFPSCWDGVNLDSPDHRSHMSYPEGNSAEFGNCPSTHPVRLITLFYEQVFDVIRYPYQGEGTWILSNGDTTGYGFHGDFVNGWEDSSPNSVLQQAMDTCHAQSGELKDCPPLRNLINLEKESCKYTGELPDEDVGFRARDSDIGNIPDLPGCNLPWIGDGPKPACSSPVPDPAFKPIKLSTIPPGWSETGCYTEAQGGRALRGASITDAKSMTKQMCVEFCASKGFSLAGVEYSQECYCDNQLRAGSVPADKGKCSHSCAGNFNENCGGGSHLTVFTRTGAPTPSTTSSTTSVSTTAKPSSTTATTLSTTTTSTSSTTVTSPTQTPPTITDWTYKGCIADSTGSRVLRGSSLTHDSMTVQMCTAHCLSKGYKIAGAEFGRECFCADSYSSGAGALVDESKCSQRCAGDSTQTCGGPGHLSVYTLANAPSTGSDLTQGWEEVGCVSEPASGRLLTGASMVNEQMTQGTCTFFCNQKGFKIAGIEWRKECYCGNSLSTGSALTSSLVDASMCQYKCPGSIFQSCGGDRKLTVFRAKAVTARSHKRNKARRAALAGL